MTIEQEANWAGDFGDKYHKRSPGNDLANERFFDEVLFSQTFGSIIEFGAGTGSNLRAIRKMSDAHLGAVELNQSAIKSLESVANVVFPISVLEYGCPVPAWELAFTKGLLIHIPPQHLPRAYQSLYNAAIKAILICEYFSPRLEEVKYQGLANMMWKGPHAYQMLDAYPDLKLVNYGFVSSRDQDMAQDDLNWWLLEKQT